MNSPNFERGIYVWCIDDSGVTQIERGKRYIVGEYGGNHDYSILKENDDNTQSYIRKISDPYKIAFYKESRFIDKKGYRKIKIQKIIMENKETIVLFGKPGTGKGTQGEILSKKLKYLNIITGDILRREKSSGSELGKEISNIIDDGNLVPDSMITEMMKNELEKYNINDYNGILFDGYPRTVEQAKELNGFATPTKAIFLDAPDHVLIERLLERGKVSNREDDRNAEVINNRLSNYNKQTSPLIDFYKNERKLYKVNGNKSIEEVTMDIEYIINS